MDNERDKDLKFIFDQLYSLDEYIRRFQQIKELRKDNPEFIKIADEIIGKARVFPAGTTVGFVLYPDGEIRPRFNIPCKSGPVL